MIAPNGENRSQTQDGRPLRRYKKRWAVERLFAWLQWFRRLVTRYEFHAQNFLGMVRLSVTTVVLRNLDARKRAVWLAERPRNYEERAGRWR